MEILAARAPWYVAGPLIGVIIVVLLWITNKPLGALGGYIELQEWAIRKRPDVGWRTFFILGVIGGGLLSAVGGPGWHPTLTYGSFDRLAGVSLAQKAAVLFFAGSCIGIGGRLAGGCTSGHGLCGTAFGSPASLACTATFMATAIATALALARTLGG